MFINWNWDMIVKKREDSFKGFTNFLVFDIETVKDSKMIEDIGNERERELDENNDFLPIPFHRIVSVSVLTVKKMGLEFFECVSTNDEKTAVEFFWEKYIQSFDFVNMKDPNDGQNKKHISSFPVLISINGKSFDIPVLMVRTLKYISDLNESIKKFISIHLDKFDNWEKDFPKYSHRYTKFHIDLPEDIFGRKISLKNLCYLTGIPVKEEGEGDEVLEMFKNGDLERIGRYCSEDVLATAKLFAYINQHLLYRSYNFPDIKFFEGIEPKIKVLK